MIETWRNDNFIENRSFSIFVHPFRNVAMSWQSEGVRQKRTTRRNVSAYASFFRIMVRDTITRVKLRENKETFLLLSRAHAMPPSARRILLMMIENVRILHIKVVHDARRNVQKGTCKPKSKKSAQKKQRKHSAAKCKETRPDQLKQFRV